MEKIRIRDKHPGSATLVPTLCSQVSTRSLLQGCDRGRKQQRPSPSLHVKQEENLPIFCPGPVNHYGIFSPGSATVLIFPFLQNILPWFSTFCPACSTSYCTVFYVAMLVNFCVLLLLFLYDYYEEDCLHFFPVSIQTVIGLLLENERICSRISSRQLCLTCFFFYILMWCYFVSLFEAPTPVYVWSVLS